ncbi:MAG: bifunctional glutamate N-acetyltransferase/amino-acid acetyltransferase ArgJ [Candidatus Omnitrophota bacterium]|jgi:glutamate N-acetyltransferase/amino-acid N-acetyltransferase
MKLYKKAILPLGFQANGISAGIKRSGKPDLALFYSGLPANAACLFTSNKIQAAPIIITKRHLKQSRYHRAIIANSGNANCFTGEQGLKDAEGISAVLSRAMHLKKESILVASTGIIARPMPFAMIKGSITRLVAGLSAEGIDKAKRAILTTDTFAKEVSVRFNYGCRRVTVCGVAKGAGMIAPDMATMLSFILTDAMVSQGALKKALAGAAGGSFNCITVDGCMSTNDTVIALANGAAGNTLIGPGSRYFAQFAKALNIVCLELAKMIIRDAEGATKFIRINVRQAKSVAQAKKAALNIANSNLFKTAIYGENNNFGRVIAAVGASGAEVSQKKMKVKISNLSKKDIDVDLSLGRGRASATVYTSDLTPEYIKINAGYN